MVEEITFVRNFSQDTMESDFLFIDAIKVHNLDDLLLYKHTINNAYVVGWFIEVSSETKLGTIKEERFRALFTILFEEQQIKNLGTCVGIKNISVSNLETYNSNGITSTIYKYFIKKKHFNIITSRELFSFGFSSIWDTIALQNDILVKIYDGNIEETIYSDLLLTKGSQKEELNFILKSYHKLNFNTKIILMDIL